MMEIFSSSFICICKREKKKKRDKIPAAGDGFNKTLIDQIFVSSNSLL